MGWGPSEVLQLVAAVLQSGVFDSVLKLIERLFAGSSGSEKKAEAMDVLTEDMPEKAKPIMSLAIDTRVAELNEQGVFKHAKLSGGAPVPGSGVAGDNGSFAR